MSSEVVGLEFFWLSYHFCWWPQVYCRVATWLTDWELQRTQTEHENSLTLKMYMMQFVNYYSSIFYIAFFKGQMVGRPGAYNRVFGFRQEEVSAIMDVVHILPIMKISTENDHL